MSIRELVEQREANTNADIPRDAEDNAASDEVGYQNTRPKKIERVNGARLAVLAKHFKRIAVSTWRHEFSQLKLTPPSRL